jgi:hypothetical protein
MEGEAFDYIISFRCVCSDYLVILLNTIAFIYIQNSRDRFSTTSSLRSFTESFRILGNLGVDIET